MGDEEGVKGVTIVSLLQVRLPTKSDKPAARDGEGPVIKKSVRNTYILTVLVFITLSLSLSLSTDIQSSVVVIPSVHDLNLHQ